MTTFDIFIKGINPNRLDEADDIKALAREYLQLDEKQFDTLLNSSGANCFRRGVSETDAKDYQSNLSKMGVVCIYKPGAELSSLSLVAIENEFSADGLFTCPNCSHEETLEGDQAPPEKCKKCGITIEKFREMQKLKAEKDEIKSTLLRAQQSKNFFANKQRQEEMEEKRQEALKKEVLAEIQGGRNKKPSQIMTIAASAAALIVVGGLAYAISSAIPSSSEVKPVAASADTGVKAAADKGASTTASTTASAATGGSGASSSQPKPPISAQQSMKDGHDKANKVLNAVGLDADAMAEKADSHGSVQAVPDDVMSGAPDGGAVANTNGTGTTGTPATSGTQTAPVALGDAPGSFLPDAAVHPSEQSSGSTPLALRQGENNAEWDLFLSKGVTALVAKNILTDAVRVSGQIVGNEDYVNAMGVVLAAAQKTGQTQLVTHILSAIENRIGELSVDEQAQYFAQAGRYQAKITQSNALLERADKIFTTLTDPESQLKASLNIAVNYVKAGNTGGANRYLKQTSALLSNVHATDLQVSSRAAIARAYNDIGNQNTATKWLTSTDKFTATLTGKARQELVDSYAYTDQLPTAISLIKQDASPSKQSELLLSAINVSLKANLTQNALTLSKEIQDPFSKVLAYDQIASYALPSNDSLALAEQSLMDIKNPADQAIASSLLARHYVRLSNTKKADALSQLAAQQLATVSLVSKDSVIAVITKNLARSLQIEQAKQQLASIQSPAIKETLNADITKIADIAGMLK